MPIIKYSERSKNEYMIIGHILRLQHQYPIDIRLMPILNQIDHIVASISVTPDTRIDVLKSEETSELGYVMLAAD